MERGGSAVGRGGESSTCVGGKFLLELHNLRAEAEPRCPQDIDHGLNVRLGDVGPAERNVDAMVADSLCLGRFQIRIETWQCRVAGTAQVPDRPIAGTRFPYE